MQTQLHISRACRALPLPETLNPKTLNPIIKKKPKPYALNPRLDVGLGAGLCWDGRQAVSRRRGAVELRFRLLV